MAAAITFSPTEGEAYAPVTVTMTGFSLSSAYTVKIVRASSGNTYVPVTTDGSGAATFTWVPNGPGASTFTAALTTPAVEATATYTAVEA